MEQKASQSPKTNEYKTSTDNSPLVEIKRTFNAPIEEVWKAWSDPSMIKQWWGPREFTASSAKTDFKEGGQYVFAMKSPQGQVLWSAGTYEEIIPHQKIVYTDQFSDENGNPITPEEAGMPNWPGEGLTYVTVDFESKGEQTKMTLTHSGLPKSMHDDCVSGWSTSIDKMQLLVERAH